MKDNSPVEPKYFMYYEDNWGVIDSKRIAADCLSSAVVIAVAMCDMSNIGLLGVVPELGVQEDIDRC